MKSLAVFLLWLVLLSPLVAMAQDGAVYAQWEQDIRAFEAADRDRPPRPGGVVFVGSSSIRLWESLAADFPGIDVANRGFGGSEIAESTHFADRILVPRRPRLIVLYAGDNDLQNGKSPVRVRDDFRMFVERVRKDLSGVRIAYIAIKPSPARVALLPKARAANKLIRDYAAGQSGVEFIDVFTPMLDAKGRPRPELFAPDALHMNRAGYALWRERVAPYLRRSPEVGRR